MFIRGNWGGRVQYLAGGKYVLFESYVRRTGMAPYLIGYTVRKRKRKRRREKRKYKGGGVHFFRFNQKWCKLGTIFQCSYRLET